MCTGLRARIALAAQEMGFKKSICILDKIVILAMFLLMHGPEVLQSTAEKFLRDG